MEQLGKLYKNIIDIEKCLICPRIIKEDYGCKNEHPCWKCLKMETISEDYRKLNSDFHKVSSKFGSKGFRIVGYYSKMPIKYKNIIDYGCGKATFARDMAKNFPDVNIQSYDPAIPEYNIEIKPAELLVCRDVLEHIEPEYLENVLQHIYQNTLEVALFWIATAPSKESLGDQTNAHRIVEKPEWWKEKLSKYFKIKECKGNNPVFIYGEKND